MGTFDATTMATFVELLFCFGCVAPLHRPGATCGRVGVQSFWHSDCGLEQQGGALQSAYVDGHKILMHLFGTHD